MKKLLITRFALESAWGGEEEIHLLLAQVMRQKGYEIALLTSCPYLSEAFRRASFLTVKAFRFLDPVSKLSILLFPLTAIYFFFLGLFYLTYFRVKGYRRVLFLRLAEKVIWTPLALVLGYEKIFWGEHVPLGRWFFQNPLLPFYRLWSKKAIIITPAEDMARQLRAVLPKAKVEVVPNALAPEQDLSNLSRSQVGLKKLLGRRYRTGLNVGYAGRLAREKGLFHFLFLAGQNPEINFLIAGTGSLRADLEKEAPPNVFFLGFLSRPSLRDFYAGLDVFCLLSEREPFGIVLLEAMSASLPILASPSGAIPEIVTHRKNGFLSKEPQKYLRLLANHSKMRLEMGEEARRSFQKKYSIELFIARVEKIFFH